jgi:hypothetical protein
MGRLGLFDEDDYLPEFGTLVVRDIWVREPAPPVPDLLDEYATDAQPSGTIARAGNGWLEGAAGDRSQRVRLEYHDEPPADDHGGWDDVVETPYRSRTGAVCLTTVTGAGERADLTLGGPGTYRVRVTRRYDEEQGDRWRLRFWPAEPEPPRWLARRDPVVRQGDSGWQDVLGFAAEELTWIVSAAAGDGWSTMNQVREWGVQHARPAGWLDEPLWPHPMRPLTTGHPDLDASARQRHASAVADQEQRRSAAAGVAAQVGAPAPTTRRELVAVLVAAGVLRTDGPDRYRPAEEPPRAQDVLTLPPEQVAALNRRQAQRYRGFATDILWTALWSRQNPFTVTVPALAERLLATPADVRATLEFIATERLTTVTGDGPVSIAVLPKRPPSTVDTPRPAVARRAARPVAVESAPGPPPRAGVVTGAGEVVVWRAGEPVVLARLDGKAPLRAVESAHGILVLGPGEPNLLVRPDGGVEPLGDELSHHVALSSDGRHLAIPEQRYGRWPRHRLHLVDLAGGSRQTMPWDESQDFHVLGQHEGAVYVQHHYPIRTMRWRPGTPPEPLGHDLRELDPVSGTALAADRDGLVVIAPDGTRRRLALDAAATLAPGGQSLYSYRYSPPAVTIFDLATGEPRIHWLPAGAQVTTSVPWQRPVWEDLDHLLIPFGEEWQPRAQAIRLNLRTGTLEHVPLPRTAGGRAILIEPLIGTQDGSR